MLNVGIPVNIITECDERTILTLKQIVIVSHDDANRTGKIFLHGVDDAVAVFLLLAFN